MLHYVPLHLSALDCQELPIQNFLRDITPNPLPLTYLCPGDWYTLPFNQDGVFVWTPPPAVADVAVELMAKAIHVRPWNAHIFLCPGLMTSRWHKLLGKATDIMMMLPFDADF